MAGLRSEASSSSVKQGYRVPQPLIFLCKDAAVEIIAQVPSPSSQPRPIQSKPAASDQRPAQALELMIGSMVGMVQAGRSCQSNN